MLPGTHKPLLIQGKRR